MPAPAAFRARCGGATLAVTQATWTGVYTAWRFHQELTSHPDAPHRGRVQVYLVDTRTREQALREESHGPPLRVGRALLAHWTGGEQAIDTWLDSREAVALPAGGVEVTRAVLYRYLLDQVLNSPYVTCLWAEPWTTEWNVKGWWTPATPQDRVRSGWQGYDVVCTAAAPDVDPLLRACRHVLTDARVRLKYPPLHDTPGADVRVAVPPAGHLSARTVAALNRHAWLSGLGFRLALNPTRRGHWVLAFDVSAAEVQACQDPDLQADAGVLARHEQKHPEDEVTVALADAGAYVQDVAAWAAAFYRVPALPSRTSVTRCWTRPTCVNRTYVGMELTYGRRQPPELFAWPEDSVGPTFGSVTRRGRGLYLVGAATGAADAATMEAPEVAWAPAADDHVRHALHNLYGQVWPTERSLQSAYARLRQARLHPQGHGRATPPVVHVLDRHALQWFLPREPPVADADAVKYLVQRLKHRWRVATPEPADYPAFLQVIGLWLLRVLRYVPEVLHSAAHKQGPSWARTYTEAELAWIVAHVFTAAERHALQQTPTPAGATHRRLVHHLVVRTRLEDPTDPLATRYEVAALLHHRPRRVAPDDVRRWGPRLTSQVALSWAVPPRPHDRLRPPRVHPVHVGDHAWPPTRLWQGHTQLHTLLNDHLYHHQSPLHHSPRTLMLSCPQPSRARPGVLAVSTWPHAHWASALTRHMIVGAWYCAAQELARPQATWRALVLTYADAWLAHNTPTCLGPDHATYAPAGVRDEARAWLQKQNHAHAVRVQADPEVLDPRDPPPEAALPTPGVYRRCLVLLHRGQPPPAGWRRTWGATYEDWRRHTQSVPTAQLVAALLEHQPQLPPRPLQYWWAAGPTAARARKWTLERRAWQALGLWLAWLDAGAPDARPDAPPRDTPRWDRATTQDLARLLRQDAMLVWAACCSGHQWAHTGRDPSPRMPCPAEWLPPPWQDKEQAPSPVARWRKEHWARLTVPPTWGSCASEAAVWLYVYHDHLAPVLTSFPHWHWLDLYGAADPSRRPPPPREIGCAYLWLRLVLPADLPPREVFQWYQAHAPGGPYQASAFRRWEDAAVRLRAHHGTDVAEYWWRQARPWHTHGRSTTLQYARLPDTPTTSPSPHAWPWVWAPLVGGHVNPAPHDGDGDDSSDTELNTEPLSGSESDRSDPGDDEPPAPAPAPPRVAIAPVPPRRGSSVPAPAHVAEEKKREALPVTSAQHASLADDLWSLGSEEEQAEQGRARLHARDQEALLMATHEWGDMYADTLDRWLHRYRWLTPLPRDPQPQADPDPAYIRVHDGRRYTFTLNGLMAMQTAQYRRDHADPEALSVGPHRRPPPKRPAPRPLPHPRDAQRVRLTDVDEEEKEAPVPVWPPLPHLPRYQDTLAAHAPQVLARYRDSPRHAALVRDLDEASAAST